MSDGPRHRSDSPTAKIPAAPNGPGAPAPRRQAPPDDRLTAIIPPVRDDTAPILRDPIEAVKAALDGTPPPPVPPPPPAHGRPPAGGDGGAPPPPKFSQQISWKWVRRSLYLAAVVLIVLPILTFGMAYLIVDVPQAG